jgi:hypothetical protein
MSDWLLPHLPFLPLIFPPLEKRGTQGGDGNPSQVFSTPLFEKEG